MHKDSWLFETEAPVEASIYLAGPFFTPEEIKRIEIVENTCEELGIKCFSPRKFLILPPKASLLERKKVFDDNVRSIRRCAAVLALVDTKDSGTFWEMGFAFGIRKPVAAAILEETSKVNVMLAQSCDGFLRNQEEVFKFLKGKDQGYAEHERSGKSWDFNWEVANEWLKEIY